MPDEAEARQLCLGEEVEAPDLANLKDFFRFYIATSQERIDSINTFAQWFFAGFTCVTGTPIKEEDRKDVYQEAFVPWSCGALASSSQIFSESRCESFGNDTNFVRPQLEQYKRSAIV